MAAKNERERELQTIRLLSWLILPLYAFSLALAYSVGLRLQAMLRGDALFDSLLVVNTALCLSTAAGAVLLTKLATNNDQQE